MKIVVKRLRLCRSSLSTRARFSIVVKLVKLVALLLVLLLYSLPFGPTARTLHVHICKLVVVKLVVKLVVKRLRLWRSSLSTRAKFSAVVKLVVLLDLLLDLLLDSPPFGPTARTHPVCHTYRGKKFVIYTSNVCIYVNICIDIHVLCLGL